MKTECPKCGSLQARYQTDNGVDLSIHCLCGYRKVVYSELENITVQHNQPREDIRLPREGTHLWKTLKALVGHGTANSADIAQTLCDLGNKFTVSDVSSYLAILRSRGLVEAPESRRGVQGGSTWNLTSAAKTLLGV